MKSIKDYNATDLEAMYGGSDKDTGDIVVETVIENDPAY